MLNVFALLMAQNAVPMPHDLDIDMRGYPYPFPVGRLRTKEGTMAYMDVRPTGKASGRSVFLLHGKNFFGAYWKGTIDRLRAAGYRVVVPDRLGFGKSAKPLIDYTFDLFAANDVALADALGIKTFAVVGHSMGGMEAVRLAFRYPKRVTRLVLEDPLGLEDYAANVPYQSVQARAKGERTQTDAAYRAYVSGYYVHKAPGLIEPFVAIRAALRRAKEFPRWAEVAARTTNTILYGTTLPELRRLTLPTLLIVGEADRTSVGKAEVPEDRRASVGDVPRLTQAAAKAMPHARVVILPDVGHIPHLESPAPFYRTLLTFLRG